MHAKLSTQQHTRQRNDEGHNVGKQDTHAVDDVVRLDSACEGRGRGLCKGAGLVYRGGDCVNGTYIIDYMLNLSNNRTIVLKKTHLWSPISRSDTSVTEPRQVRKVN